MSDVENKIILRQMETEQDKKINEGCGAGITLLIGAALIIYVVFVAC